MVKYKESDGLGIKEPTFKLSEGYDESDGLILGRKSFTI